MDCALWLNRKKISAASEIPGNLDIASLRGYFLAGSLVPWLCEHDGRRYAKRLAALAPDDPLLNDKIAQIFGGSINASAPYKGLEGGSADSAPLISALASFNIGSAGSYNYAALSSFGSFYSFAESLSNTGSGSLGFWEYITSFSSLSSYSRHEWEWLWNLLFGGSSSFGITSGGSFAYGWEWLWNLLFGGSSYFGVTSGGSFAYGWEWLRRLFFGGQGSFGSFDWSVFGFGSFGSFQFNMLKMFEKTQSDNAQPIPPLDEYDFILLKTLINCPLDRFGYGIHNI